MDSVPSMYLFFLSFLSSHFVCSSSDPLLPSAKDFVHQQPKTSHQLTSDEHEIRRDFLNPSTTDFPTAPVTNPVTTPSTGIGMFPPVTPTPTIVTVPSTSPTGLIPTPFSNVNPPAVTNPVTTPGMTGGSIGNVQGSQSWCVAVSGMPDSVVQAALDYACGNGGADCSTIQDGGNCYNPNTLQYHASYAFNSYYQRNPVPTSCAFGGVAVLTYVNPSSGSCIFSASQTISSPTTAVPTTESSTGATPTSTGSGMPQPGFLNPSNPGDTTATGGYGQDPTIGDSLSGKAQPLVGWIIATTPIITARIIFSVY